MLVALAVLAGGACNRGGDTARVVLDGRPRPPDDQGIVTAVSFERITLDGERTFRVTRDLQSFSTQTMQPLPLLHRKGQYVHVGLDGDRLAWIAAVGSPLGDPPVVYYTGTLEKVQSRTATFADGTVLAVAAGVEPPAPTGFVQVEIDPSRNVVTAMRAP